MKCSKKGSTLIELEVHILIICIIFTISLVSYKEIIKFFNNSINILNTYNEFDDAYINLRNILACDDIKRIEIKDNAILVYSYNKYKIITNEEKKIKIKYYTFINKGVEKYYYETSNVLIENINDFEIEKKNNIIYISMSKGGISYIMCL